MSEYKRGDFDPTDARSALPELEGVFERPPYAPTPLNPYGLTKDGTPYVMHAHGVITDVFNTNLNRLPYRPPSAVVELLETSIATALFRRFDNNSGKTLPPDCDDETAALFAAACLGRAMPIELIELLNRRPGDLKSIELAKQTCPFDWDATADMDIAIDSMLSEYHFAKRGSERTQNTRYYYIHSDNEQDPAAVIVVRKADLGTRSCGTDGDMTVVQRDSFVLDLTHDDAQEVGRELRLWLQSEEADARTIGNKKTLYTGPLLPEFIGTQLTARSDLRSPALYPGVRSYYAFCKTSAKGGPDDSGEA